MKKIGILTGGGDVPPLNALIAAAAETARTANVELIGFIKGWEGVLEERFIKFTDFPIHPEVGGTFLKSSRIGLQSVENGTQKALDVLAKHDIEGLIVVGGEDTLSNAFFLSGYRQVLIAKTIDNDVGKIDYLGKEINAEFEPENVLNYFTLGFPTAAEKIASFVSLKEGLRTTAYSHERIIIVEAMGMHAGWLALAAGLGHPDFIIIPEFPLDYKRFLEIVISKYERRRHLIIVIAEGARWENESFIYAEKDIGLTYGHPRFGGAAEAIRSCIKKDLIGRFDTRNINAVNPSYLYRSGAPNALDRTFAEKLGRRAVEALLSSAHETSLMTIQKRGEIFKVEEYSLSRFVSMTALHRFVDERFYDRTSYCLTEIGKKYLTQIAREINPGGEYGFEKQ